MVDGPQRAHLNLNQLHNVADAKDDIDPLKRRHLDAPTIEEKPLIDEVPSLVEGKARPPPSTKFLVGEVDVGQRCWVVGSSTKEVASRRLDLVQLEHAQGTFVEGIYLSTITYPTSPPGAVAAVPKGRGAPPQVPGRRGPRGRFYYTRL